MKLETIILKLKLIFIPCEENKYRPKFLESKFLYYYAISLLILKISIIPFLICLPKSVFFADITKTSLVELANQTRASFGLQPLNINPLLEEAAYLKLKDMFEKDYFSHISPDGITPWYWFQNAGYNYKFAGENLAIGFLDSEEVHRAWLNSSSHRDIILNPNYSEIGIAVLTSEFQGRKVPIVVQHFGAPQPQIKIMEEETAPPEKVETTIEKPVEEPEVESVPESPAEKELSPAEKPAETEAVVQAQPIQSKEVLAAFKGVEDRNNLSFRTLSFLASDYYNLLQKVIYLSLIFITISLFITVFFDLFIYRAFEIQYKDIVLKAVCFSVLFAVLLLIDKSIMIQIIPHEFSIY